MTVRSERLTHQVADRGWRSWPRVAEAHDGAAAPRRRARAIEYEGEGDPDLLIASDLPMQGPSRVVTEQMVAAVQAGARHTRAADWKAGDYNVAYQACDDSTAQAAN